MAKWDRVGQDMAILDRTQHYIGPQYMAIFAAGHQSSSPMSTLLPTPVVHTHKAINSLQLSSVQDVSHIYDLMAHPEQEINF